MPKLATHFLALALMLVGGALSQAVHADNEIVEIEVLHHTDETDADLERVRSVLVHIPAKVQKQIAAKGIHIVLTPRLIYDEPEHSGQTLFRNGNTFDNAGGVFEPNRKRVLLPERASWGNGPPRPQGNYLKNVLPHELGHAWDSACEGLSHGKGFESAYDQDVQKLTNEQMRKLQYYITGTAGGDSNVPTKSGKGECLATAFAKLVAPVDQRDKNGFCTAFPHVLEFLQTYEPSLRNANWQSPAVPRQTGASKPVSEESRSDCQAEINAATELLTVKRYAEAISHLNRAISLDPEQANAYLLKGNADCWLKNYSQAIESYSRFIKLKPNDPQGYQLRALAYGWMGEVTLQRQDEFRAHRLSKAQQTNGNNTP